LEVSEASKRAQEGGGFEECGRSPWVAAQASGQLAELAQLIRSGSAHALCVQWLFG